MSTENNQKSKLAIIFDNPSAIFLLLLIMALICFWPSLHGDFVLDDKYVVVDNELIKSIKTLPKLFINTYWGENFSELGNYRPISNLSFAIEYALFGLNPFGYHLVSILLHTLNGFLIYWLICFYTQRNRLAVIAALLFIAHPIHTEAVCNIAQRTELLSTTFILLGWIFYCLRSQKRFYYWLSLLIYLLAAMAKETGILLIGILILADICADWKSWSRQLSKYLYNYAGYFVVAVVYLLLRISVVGHVGVKEDYTFFKDTTFFTRLFTMSQGFVKYIQLAVWPKTLCATYDFSWIPKATTMTLPVGLSLGFLAIVIATGLVLLLRERLSAFAILFFFLTLASVSNLFFITGILISERALYLPAVSACLLIGLGLDWLIRRGYQAIALAMLALLLSLSIVQDYRYSFNWQNNDVFMTSLVRTAPDSPNALIMFAGYCSENNRLPEAEATFKRLIELMPDRAIPYGSLGELYIKEDRYQEAMPLLQRAIELSSNFPSYFTAIAKVYNQRGEYPQAAEALRRAIEISKPNAYYYHERGLALFNAGDKNGALEMLQRAIEIKPDLAIAHSNLGMVLRSVNRVDQAMVQLRAAIELEPNNAAFHNAYGNALLAQERLPEALQEFTAAINLDNNFVTAYNNLGVVYLKLQRYQEARRAFEIVLQIDPNHINAQRNLALLKAEETQSTNNQKP